VGGIEVHIVGYQPGQEARPVVFYTHGRTGAIDPRSPQLRELAEAGFVVVALDQRNHGRRLIYQRLNQDWNADIPSAMYAIMLGTAMDVSLLIDMMPAQLGLEMPRIGMTGGSLGGHVTLLAMAMDERISVGGAMVPSGDYRQLMELRAESRQTPAEDWPEYYPAALNAAVRKFDPLHNAKAYSDRPLLLTCGGADPLVPPQTARSFYDAVKPCYTKPDRLKLSVYDGVGHDVTPDIWAENLDWLKRWLIDCPNLSAAT
jgi:dipeptidyl aminopeptidase/acylaminoacyl peptidase